MAGIARPGPDLDSLAGAAGPDAGQLLPVAADVVSPGQVAAAFEEAMASLGRPTLVVACAGVAGALGPAGSADPGRWWDAVTVDLRGTMLTAQCAIRQMLPVGAGRLVTTYGNLGDRQQGNVSAFAVAKAGIARLTESLAGDAHAVTELIEAIASGAADELTGRVLLAGDDLGALARACRRDPDHRRLRLSLD